MEFGFKCTSMTELWHCEISSARATLRYVTCGWVLCRWSFGVVLWEIYSAGDNPYPSVPLESLYRTLRAGYQMSKPDAAADEMSVTLCLRSRSLHALVHPTGSLTDLLFRTIIQLARWCNG